MPVIDCPVCKGTGTYHATDIYGDEETGRCTACKGSCKIKLTEDQYQRKINYKKKERRRLYTDTEKAIMRLAPTAKQAYKELVAAGITDRTYKAVITWRGKNGVKSGY